MITKAFYEELENIAVERHLEVEDVKKAVEMSLIKATQLMFPKGAVEVEFNDEQKKIRIYSIYHVVEEVDPEGEEGQITLEEAKEIRARVRIGSEIRTEVKFASLERKGAARFGQLLNQYLRELQNKRAYEYFKEREGEMITATVIGRNERAIKLNIGMSTLAFMPVEETLPGEACGEGTPIKVAITKVEETGKGPKVFVSRNNKELIKRLFEMYIPEIASGVVEIIALAREPGSRTKIGIKSNNVNVDAKGACVGLNGSRIKQINDALNGERIDIFEWKENPVQLIAEALTPAKVISVLVNEEEKRSVVIVPDQQFSLAIGKGGQNARLASQTTGWKIDIKDETAAYREEIKFKPNVY